ncbi:MAG: alpha/beta hydrolase [Chitinophagales bacterium]
MILIILIGGYVLLCVFLYFSQESMLFFPSKTPKDYHYHFAETFEELDFEAEKGVLLNALLFKTKKQVRKGVVLFLHGNGGAIEGWGEGAWLYTQSAYDVLYLDYRSYGKSGGKISSENQLVKDAQIAYDYLKERYGEEQIVVSGTSMGTGIAARMAAQNKPIKLLLNAPYWSLQSLALEKVKVVPSFLIKYKFQTYKHLQEVKCPVVVFHGSQDEVIPQAHSLRLGEAFPYIEVNIVEGFGHNDLSSSREYMLGTKEALE